VPRAHARDPRSNVGGEGPLPAKGARVTGSSDPFPLPARGLLRGNLAVNTKVLQELHVVGEYTVDNAADIHIALSGRRWRRWWSRKALRTIGGWLAGGAPVSAGGLALRRWDGSVQLVAGRGWACDPWSTARGFSGPFPVMSKGRLGHP